MLQVDVSMKDRTTYYITVDAEYVDFHKHIVQNLMDNSNLSDFLTLVDSVDDDFYMIRISEIKCIMVHVLCKGDDE